MKFNSKINLPEKSIFGFEILSCVHSSLSCYLLLIFGRFLNPLFGSDKLQIITGTLFNLVLNVSIVILIVNLIIKRKQQKKIYFIFINSFLFIYLPIALYFIFRCLLYLIIIWF